MPDGTEQPHLSTGDRKETMLYEVFADPVAAAARRYFILCRDDI